MSATVPVLLLSDIEAARVLRLADDAPSDECAVKRLNRLVDSGQLRPALVGKRRRYSIREIERFIDARTDQYAEARA